MIIRINPLDTFFFRDAKPFDLGEETWADSIFPPAPSVIYGALRTLYFIQENSLHLEKKQLDELTKDFKILSIFIQVGESEYLLPLMNDIVRDKKTKDLLFLQEKENDLISSSVAQKILISPVRAEEVKGFVDINAYSNLLSKIIIDKDKIRDDLIVKEPKIGIARNNQSHGNEDKKMYRVEMQRFNTQKYKNMQLVIICENLPLTQGSYTSKMGGEGKPFSYSVENIEIPKNGFVEVPKLENDTFRLCLTTPALLEKGWLPSWLDEKTLEGRVPNSELKLKLLTTFLGKPVSFGGFDLKEKKPKEMNKYVPAGAVYYFQILEGTAQQVIDIFHFKSISELGSASQGFGITYVGV